jgi:hypothetical protein
VTKTCAADGCENDVPPRTGRHGRPPVYCSPECRKNKPSLGRLVVEIDHEPIEDEERPSGRVFLVRLRRGDKTVTIAEQLGRPSAELLAYEITELLPRQRGGTIG